MNAEAVKITPSMVRSLLSRRRKDTTKRDYGHLLIVGGSGHMLGAVLLAARGASRSGCGLVSVACAASVRAFVYAHMAEALTLGLRETAEGDIDAGNAPDLVAYMKDRKVTALVLGPGLGRGVETLRFARDLMRKTCVPCVIDADAIEEAVVTAGMGFKAVTPHKGEFARLTGLAMRQMSGTGYGVCADYAKRHLATVLLLKGHESKVFYGDRVWMNPTGNPGMAKGGSGDVLSGIMGSLLAQRFVTVTDNDGLLPCVLAATYLHGLAGDVAAKSMGQYSMTPGDIIRFLPQAIRRITKG
ncbi:MAG: NAD(P)H-hydrate dehydratase [Elusimicrobiota bacterium]